MQHFLSILFSVLKLVDYYKKFKKKIVYYDVLNGWQLANMKKSIPDMSLT